MKKSILTIAAVITLVMTALNCKAATNNDGGVNKKAATDKVMPVAKSTSSVENKLQVGETKVMAVAVLSNDERNDLRNEISDLKVEAKVANSKSIL